MANAIICDISFPITNQLNVPTPVAGSGTTIGTEWVYLTPQFPAEFAPRVPIIARPYNPSTPVAGSGTTIGTEWVYLTPQFPAEFAPRVPIIARLYNPSITTDVTVSGTPPLVIMNILPIDVITGVNMVPGLVPIMSEVYTPIVITDVNLLAEVTPVNVLLSGVDTIVVGIGILTEMETASARALIYEMDKVVTLIMGRTTPKQIKAQSQVPVLYQITDHQNKVPDHVLARINENFKILEMTLNNKIGTDSGLIIDSTSGLDVTSLVIIGIDAQKPKVNKRHGRLFYWAYDTEKLYVLRPNPE